MRCEFCGSENCKWIYYFKDCELTERTNMYKCLECDRINVWKVKDVLPKEI